MIFFQNTKVKISIKKNNRITLNYELLFLGLEEVNQKKIRCS
jgi:hypothetical protein